MAESNSISAPTVLVTGCSEGGIGAALVEAFHARGLHVFATARNLAKMPYLEKLENVTPLQLDVSSSSSIAAAVEAVKTKTGGELNYLINNAAQPIIQPALDVSIEEAKKMLDVNFWAVLELTQAFAPLLIAAKGSIVNISSVAARINTPWLGIYSASKAALTTYSETLRLEMEPFGVKVLSVMTGSIGTSSMVSSRDWTLPEGSIYMPAIEAIKTRATGEKLSSVTPPADYAKAVVNDVLGGSSGAIWRGAMSTSARILSTLAPTWLLDRALKADSGLDRLP